MIDTGGTYYRLSRLFPDDAQRAASWYVQREPVPDALADRLPEIFRDLLARRILLGGKVDRRIGPNGKWRMAAFGLAGFLHPRLAKRLLKTPHPFLAIHILDRVAREGVRGTLLSPRRVASDNAAQEPRLHLVGLCWLQDNYDFINGDGRNLLEGAFQLMANYVSGYNLATIIFEGHAPFEEVFRAAGFQRIIDFSGNDDPAFADLRADPRYWPHLQGVFMRSAVTGVLPGTPVARLFMHRRPQFGLTDAQKSVVDLALDGLSDAEIARLLGIRENAVQMRWKHVYERIQNVLPDFFAAYDGGDMTPVRGREKRRRVLDFMKDHREELRPWKPASPAGRKK